MAPKMPQTDVKLAKSIVGFSCPRALDFWWAGCDSRKLSCGKSGLVDVESGKQMFVLDSDGTDCPLTCTAVCQCVNAETLMFGDCIVPPDRVLKGTEEDVGVNSTIHRVLAADQWEKIDENNLLDNGNTARVMEPIPWTVCSIRQMFSGNPSMAQLFLTRDWFDACEPTKQSMTPDCSNLILPNPHVRQSALIKSIEHFSAFNHLSGFLSAWQTNCQKK